MKPNFSGEWILDRQASDLNGGASAMQSGFLRIDHRNPECAFHISMNAEGDSVERRWESVLSEDVTDSAEVSATQEGFYSRLFWFGEMMVFECGSNGPDATWSMSWRYELLESGQRLRAFERMRGHGGDFDNTWIFEKAQPRL